jgi:hypothetical protein
MLRQVENCLLVTVNFGFENGSKSSSVNSLCRHNVTQSGFGTTDAVLTTFDLVSVLYNPTRDAELLL